VKRLLNEKTAKQKKKTKNHINVRLTWKFLLRANSMNLKNDGASIIFYQIWLNKIMVLDHHEEVTPDAENLMQYLISD